MSAVLHQFLVVIDQLARERGVPVYLVGGVVRDALYANLRPDGTVPELLSVEDVTHDFDCDLVFEGDARDMASLLGERCTDLQVTRHDSFMTAKVVLPSGEHIDFVTARTEVYPEPGALPVVTPAPLTKDFIRRDFSINALAISLADFLAAQGQLPTKQIIDHVGGVDDVVRRTLRIFHTGSFIDDPTRLFRAARYASRFALTNHQITQEALQASISKRALANISAQRVLNELQRVMLEPDVAGCFRWLHETQVISEIPLFSEVAYTELLRIARDLATVPVDVRFDTFLVALYTASSPDRREDLFRQYGFGRKFFNAVRKQHA